MNKINLTIVLKTLALVWLIPFIYQFLFNDLSSGESATVAVQPYELKVVDSQNNARLDNSEIVRIFDKLGPPKSNEDAEKSDKTPVKKIIDKTLLPNFRRFDDENQVGLAAIFNDGTPFVVIELKNYETQLSRFERITEGEELGEYRLTKISGDFIEFTKDNEQLTLQLFTTK